MKRTMSLVGFVLPWLAVLGLASAPAPAEDIDIYTQPPTANTNNVPNVLIILDNTSNWNNNAQHWPGGISQGQAEIKAIAAVLNALPDGSANVGLMMNSNAVGGSGTGPGAYMRFAMRLLTPAVKQAWLDLLGMELNGGNVVPKASCTVTANSVSKTPNCMYQNAQQSINSSGEQGASSAEYSRDMFEAFKYYGGHAAPDGTSSPQDRTHFGPYRFADDPGPLGSGESAIARLDYGAFSDWNPEQKIGWVYNAPSNSGCAGNYIIFIGNGLPSRDSAAISTDMVTNVHFDASKLPWQDYTLTSVSHTDQCFYTTATCTADACSSADFPAECSDGTYASCTCGTAQTDGCGSGAGTTQIKTTACQASFDPASDYPAGCSDGTYASCSYHALGDCSTTGDFVPCDLVTTNCLANANSCGGNDLPSECGTSYANCSCGSSIHDTTGCNGNKAHYCVGGYPVIAGKVWAVDAETETPTQKYCIDGTYTADTMVATGSPAPPTGNVADLYADEWAKYLYQSDADTTDGQQNITTFTINVFNAKPDPDQTALLQNMASYGGGTYYEATSEDRLVYDLTQIFIDIQSVNSVFAASSLPINATNRAQNENQVYIGMFRPDHSALPRWFGNTKRYQLGLIPGTTRVDLLDMNDSPAINTAKEGFIRPCAASWWTSETSFLDGNGNLYGYWGNTGTYPDPKGDANCVSSSDHSPYSDYPDGPFVEKGAVAEVLRRGNDPSSVDAESAPPWHVNRKVETLNVDGTALADLDTTTAASVSQTVIDFTKGYDVPPQEYPYNTFSSDCSIVDGTACGSRPSIHGDVVHSRPLAVNYGGSDKVVLFYGSNDGTYRAVQASTGKELWAFVAPESFGKLQRLYDDNPAISYPNTAIAGSTPKDYFWDGSTGIWQIWSGDAPTKTYIYPTARRGGRYLYALNVTDPASPAFLWRHPNSDDGHSFDGMGETWSTPNVAYVTKPDHSRTAVPRAIFGGGYDTCEDADYPDTDATNFTCGASPRGAGIYVLNAETGSLKFHASTGGRSVAGDVTLVDLDGDGNVDAGYFADTAGNLYRINFTDAGLAGLASDDDATPDAFTVTRIAYTTGSGRKFLYAPAAVVNAGRVILALGSGDREHPLIDDYPYTTPVLNRFYVFVDHPLDTVTTPVNLDDTSVMKDMSTPPDDVCNFNIADNATFRGWFMDLCGLCDPSDPANDKGEQTVTSALIQAGIVFFSTNRPLPDTTDVCTGNLGEARGYAVNLVNSSGVIQADGLCGGKRSNVFLNGGLPPSPVAAHVPIRMADGTVIVTAVLGGIQIDGTPSSVIGGQQVKPRIKSKRRIVYWHTDSD